MIFAIKARKKFAKLLDENNKLLSKDKSGQNTPGVQIQLHSLKYMLSTTIQHEPANVDSLIKKNQKT